MLLAWWGLSTFDNPAPGEAGIRFEVYLQALVIAALFGWLYPALWLKDRLALRKQARHRERGGVSAMAASARLLLCGRRHRKLHK